VDTSVWSLVLRRTERNKIFAKILKGLIENGQLVIMGVIKQELLSGIPDKKQYDRLRLKLSYFPDIPIETEDHEKAAIFFNKCRSKGIQGSHIDFLICAVAHTHDLEILTTDKDFEKYSDIIPIKFYK